MSQKENMLNGLIYDAFDEELRNDRIKCKNLCYAYNLLKPDEIEKRKEILKQILGKTKHNFIIEQPFNCDYGYNIELGENFYANHNMIILDCAKVKFGNNVFIGPNCTFNTPQHPLDVETRIKGLEYAFEIKVEDNVWLGSNVTVLPGVTIGKNSIIGAASVVTKNIEPNVIACGNPCRVIREIKEDDKYRFEKRN